MELQYIVTIVYSRGVEMQRVSSVLSFHELNLYSRVVVDWQHFKWYWILYLEKLCIFCYQKLNHLISFCKFSCNLVSLAENSKRIILLQKKLSELIRISFGFTMENPFSNPSYVRIKSLTNQVQLNSLQQKISFS